MLCALIACGEQPPPAAGPAPAVQVLADPAIIARETVAARLGIAAADVTVISVAAREFSDSSLGCHEPGMSYLQVVTPGHEVLVEADGRRFDVRVAGGHGRICHRRKPGGAPDAPPPGDSTAAIANHARQDLAKRLAAAEDRIAVLDVQPLSASESLPACAPACSDRQHCGYRIGLLHAGRRYDYYGGADGPPQPCPDIAPL
jgi:hypothetical protein